MTSWPFRKRQSLNCGCTEIRFVIHIRMALRMRRQSKKFFRIWSGLTEKIWICFRFALSARTSFCLWTLMTWSNALSNSIFITLTPFIVSMSWEVRCGHKIYSIFLITFFFSSAIYHSHAIFTMSSNFLGISDSSTKNICAYFEKSRNFARRVNTNPMQNVYFGAHDIATVLSSFGSTEHDFTSFKIDVTNYTVSESCIRFEMFT